MIVSSIANSKPIVKILSSAIAILLAIVLILGYQISRSTPTSTELQNPSSLIVRQVREVSELTTATFAMETVVPVSEKGSILGLDLVESNLLYIAHGNVRVGVDLSEFNSDSVRVEGDTITVNLPPLKILDSKLDLEHSSVYSYDRGLLGVGPDVVNLQTQAQRQALRKVEEAACQDWLIKTASDRVRKTVEHLLDAVLKERGYRVIVNTQIGGSCVIAQG
ncbi:MAG TPA: DUF4230 domain-containing protein [Oscillatoriales cyanobacterium M59_W2019_021]|nr:MAG: DUF4230 domain-containing protein [Cyanobacteria bacterium J055]HIK31574.1 DUF4230 domain-containing protein [Oscillatoriales cyanobacterium M4454_W2019_049]HIK50570.1 DUF4230 domain-containing protein [Oscillatoriales cyanobacterium M59_W2019_021]